MMYRNKIMLTGKRFRSNKVEREQEEREHQEKREKYEQLEEEQCQNEKRKQHYEYSILISLQKELESKLFMQNAQLAQFEDNLLHFYFANCYVDGNNSEIISSGDDNDNNSQRQSALGKLLLQRKVKEEHLENEERKLCKIVQAEEEKVKEELVKGALAIARKELNDVEEECSVLREELQAECTRVAKAESEVVTVNSETDRVNNEICQTKQRICALVSKREDTSNNIERLKLEAHAKELELKEAQQDLQRRRSVNKELEREVQRRTMRLEHKKVKRKCEQSYDNCNNINYSNSDNNNIIDANSTKQNEKVKKERHEQFKKYRKQISFRCQ